MTDRALLILVVDDEPAHSEAVQRALHSVPGVTIQVANTLLGYRERVVTQQPDLALVDLNLPDGRAVSILTSPPEAGAFPIVVMTSYGNEQTAVEAMRAGAIDYVVKSAEAFTDLPHTIERAMREWVLRQQRKRVEAALHESEERHRVLFQKSHDALMTLGPPAWRFNAGNAAALSLFGAISEADFESHTPWQYSPELQPDGRASAEKALDMVETAMREGSHSFDWTHRRHSGEEFPATVVLTRIELNGQPLLQATVRDESETRRLQASVAQADRLASMGMLAAGVAHEINNPLTYVFANIDSLAQDLPRLAYATERCCVALREQIGDVAFAAIAGDSDELLGAAMLADAVERAQEALEGTQRIRAIVRGLGTFSRVDRAERTRIDLRQPLEAAINMAYNEIRHRARLVKDLGPVPGVWATEGKLSQVFLNLLVNAAHAIEEGDARNNHISVRSWAEAGQVCVAIADSGKGIPAKDLERIFEPFFTTKPVGVGSGLGLAICKNILTEFGGSVNAESEIGKGTCFSIRLPVMQDEQDERRVAAISDGPKAPLVRGRILVVDDEETIRRALERLLGRNHELVTAASGEEARLLLAEDSAFDLVLCDLTMPQMSGTELHAWLKVHHPWLAKQTVFITGGVFTAKAEAELAMLDNLKLEKPFDVANLKRLVAELVIAAKSKRKELPGA